ncbi:hypothetical protein [Granulicoccus phenolivorans]|uniref:hypothetical protein n=1 Tax=Granulicoccus phenolivorans TaxID=266854 RepID=UPI00047D7269|nr:hypothetical protein [Granulicoccus phenolivorans]
MTHLEDARLNRAAVADAFALLHATGRGDQDGTLRLIRGTAEDGSFAVLVLVLADICRGLAGQLGQPGTVLTTIQRQILADIDATISAMEAEQQ